MAKRKNLKLGEEVYVNMSGDTLGTIKNINKKGVILDLSSKRTRKKWGSVITSTIPFKKVRNK